MIDVVGIGGKDRGSGGGGVGGGGGGAGGGGKFAKIDVVVPKDVPLEKTKLCPAVLRGILLIGVVLNWCWNSTPLIEPFITFTPNVLLFILLLL